MLFVNNFTEFMFRGIFQFFCGSFFLLLLLIIVAAMVSMVFESLVDIFKRNIHNTFYISEKSVDEKFLKELEKYSKRIT